MRITIIGSTQYQDKINRHADDMRKLGHNVRIPAFDDHVELDELQVCEYNLECIKWCDEVHVIWDQRSLGTIFDFGMTFALEKPLKIVWLEPKTFPGVMKRYESLYV